MIRAFTRWLFDGPDEMLPKQLARFKAAQVDGDKPIRPPKRIEGMEWPERDEIKPQCVHIWTDADVLALELKRTAEAERQPRNVIQIKVRGTVR